MTRRKRIALAIATSLLLGGWLWWRRTGRETSEKLGLRAEIAARQQQHSRRAAPRVDPVPDEDNAALLYLAAARAMDPASPTNECSRQIVVVDWESPPELVQKYVEANARALSIVKGGAGRPGCRFQDDAFFSSGGTGPFLWVVVFAQGRIETARKEFVAAAARAALLRRMARDFLPMPQGRRGLSPVYAAFHYDSRAVDLLRRVAVHPDLDEAGARAALEVLRRPPVFRAATREQYELRRRTTGEFATALLGPGAKDAMEKAGYAQVPFGDAVENLIRFRGRPDHPQSPPSSDEVRRAIATLDAILAAEEADDPRPLRPGGPLALAEAGGEGEEWPPWRITGGLLCQSHLRIRNEAHFEAVRGVLAVRLFEMRSGRPAKSWDEVVPGILDAPPRDPYTAGVLALEATADGGAVEARAWVGESRVGNSSMILQPVRIEWRRKSR